MAHVEAGEWVEDAQDREEEKENTQVIRRYMECDAKCRKAYRLGQRLAGRKAWRQAQHTVKVSVQAQRPATIHHDSGQAFRWNPEDGHIFEP